MASSGFRSCFRLVSSVTWKLSRSCSYRTPRVTQGRSFGTGKHLCSKSLKETERTEDSIVDTELKKLSQIHDEKSKATLLSTLELELESSASQNLVWTDITAEEFVEQDVFHGISLERGKTGVFDIDDLISILKKENVKDICTIAVPRELQYVDYMVITTGRSVKHLTAVAEFIRRIYKARSLPGDPSFIIEGKGNKDWVALDLGNIALHLFSHSARQTYNLESLWSVGAKYDELCNQPEDSFTSLLKQHNFNPSVSNPDPGVSGKGLRVQ